MFKHDFSVDKFNYPSSAITTSAAHNPTDMSGDCNYVSAARVVKLWVCRGLVSDDMFILRVLLSLTEVPIYVDLLLLSFQKLHNFQSKA